MCYIDNAALTYGQFFLEILNTNTKILNDSPFRILAKTALMGVRISPFRMKSDWTDHFGEYQFYNFHPAFCDLCTVHSILRHRRALQHLQQV